MTVPLRASSPCHHRIVPASDSSAAEPGLEGSGDSPRDVDTGARAASGGALRVAAQVGAAIVGLLAAPILVRQLGDDAFGRFSTVYALVMIVAAVGDLGLSTVGVADWVRRPVRERHKLWRDLLGARIIATVTMGVAALGIAALLGHDGQMLTAEAVGIVGITISAVASVLAVPLIAELRQGLVAVAEFARAGSVAVLQAVFALVGAGLIPLLAATIPAGALGVLIVWLSLGRPSVRPHFGRAGLARIARESVAFAAASATSAVYLRSSMLLVPLIAGPAAVGEFGVAYRTMEFLTAVPLLLTGALFPVIVHASAEDTGRLRTGFETMWRSSVALCVAFTAGTIAIAPAAVLVLRGSPSSIAVESLGLFGLAIGTMFLGMTSLWLLLAKRAYRTVLVINLAALTGNIALTLILGTFWNAPAAAASVAICEIGIAVASTIAAIRLVGTDGAFRRYALLSLRGGVAIVLLFAVSYALGHGRPLLHAVAVTASGGALIFALRLVPKELLALASRIFFRRSAGTSAQSRPW